MANEKTWYKSKTIWVAALQMLAGILTTVSEVLVGTMDVQTMVAGVGIAVVGLIQVIIRFYTKQSIG